MTTSVPVDTRELDGAILDKRARAEAVRRGMIIAYVTPTCVECMERSEDERRSVKGLVQDSEVIRVFQSVLAYLSEALFAEGVVIISTTEEYHDGYRRRPNDIEILSERAVKALLKVMLRGRQDPVFLRNVR